MRRDDGGHQVAAILQACARRTLSLPIFPELTREEVEYVAHVVRGFFD